MQIKSIVKALGEAPPIAWRPETFRLPRGGGGDPYFGFSRSFYYRGEELGYWRLIHIRERGKRRGLCLVPFDEVAAFVREQRGAGRGHQYVDETEERFRAQSVRAREKE